MSSQRSLRFGSSRFCTFPFLLFFLFLCSGEAQFLHLDVEYCLVEGGSDPDRRKQERTDPKSELDDVEKGNPELQLCLSILSVLKNAVYLLRPE